jgi:hypothetical protein
VGSQFRHALQPPFDAIALLDVSGLEPSLECQEVAHRAALNDAAQTSDPLRLAVAVMTDDGETGLSVLRLSLSRRDDQCIEGPAYLRSQAAAAETTSPK